MSRPQLYLIGCERDCDDQWSHERFLPYYIITFLKGDAHFPSALFGAMRANRDLGGPLGGRDKVDGPSGSDSR